MEMQVVHSRFLDQMRQFRREIMDREFRTQRTLEDCWGVTR